MSEDDEIIDAEIVEPGTDLEPIGGTEVVRARSETLLAVRQGIAELDRQREALVLADDKEALAWAAHDVDQVKRDLSDLLEAITSDLGRLMLQSHTGRGNPKLQVPGLGEVDVPGGNERKGWESAKLLHDLIWNAVYDENTGHVRHDSIFGAVDAVEQALLDTLPLSQSTAWKVGQKVAGSDEFKGGLRGRGIDPGDYCEETAKPRLAKIPTPNRKA